MKTQNFINRLQIQMNIKIKALRKVISPNVRYNSTYEVSKFSFTCADKFMGRRILRHYQDEPYNTFLQDFIGFEIISIDGMEPKENTFENHFPEFITIAKAFLAKVSNNSIICENKYQAFVLFKLFRMYRNKVTSKILFDTAELINKEIEPLKAFIVSTFYNAYKFENLSILSQPSYLFNLKLEKSASVNVTLPYSQNIKDFYKVMHFTQTLNESFSLKVPKDYKVALYNLAGRITKNYINKSSYADNIYNYLSTEDKEYILNFKKALANNDLILASTYIQTKNYWDFD